MALVFCHDKKILFLVLSLKIPSEIEKDGVSSWHLTKVDICPLFNTFALLVSFQCLKKEQETQDQLGPLIHKKRTKKTKMWYSWEEDCLVSKLQFYFTDQGKKKVD